MGEATRGRTQRRPPRSQVSGCRRGQTPCGLRSGGYPIGNTRERDIHTERERETKCLPIQSRGSPGVPRDLNIGVKKKIKNFQKTKRGPGYEPTFSPLFLLPLPLPLPGEGKLSDLKKKNAPAASYDQN